MRSFEEVARLLRQRSLNVCQALLPGGRKNGGEYVCAGLGGGVGTSLSVNLTTGVWKDFAGDEAGADLINLFAAIRGVSNMEGKLAAEKWLGLPDDGPPRVKGRVSLEADFIKPEAEEPLDQWWKGELPTMIWDYRDQDGELVSQVYRWEHPTYGKVVRPWCPKRGDWKALEGDGRPLLCLAEISAASSSAPVYVVEGEKTVDALRALGLVATTNLGGSQAVAKTDWSPLEGRHVVYCRDNDKAGRASMAKVLDLLREVKVASVRLLEPPAGSPEGWDLADATPSQRQALCHGATLSRPVVTGKPRLTLSEWGEDRYKGEPAERKMLVEGIFPLGACSMLAGMGGVGKGLRLLELAWKVAHAADPPTENGPISMVTSANTWCGARILKLGRVVLLAGEDTRLELHSRLKPLREELPAIRTGDRLTLVPLPDAGGNFPLIKSKAGTTELTEQWDRLRDELGQVEDLALVILDPLARFNAANIERDVDAGQMLLGALGALASELGIAVVVSHHMAKARGPKEARITDRQTAREAIRGSGGLVDGVRAAYALWAELDRDRAMETLEKAGVKGEDWHGAVVHGAVVKANGPHEKRIATLVKMGERFMDLEPVEEEAPPAPVAKPVRVEGVPVATPPAPPRPVADKDELLVKAIAEAAAKGMPFTHTGIPGLYCNNERLPRVFKSWGKNRLEDAAKALLLKGRIVKAAMPGEKRAVWLDVPDGPFATGNGSFGAGAAPGAGE